MAQGYELPDGFDPLGEGALDLLVKNTDFLTRQIREPIQILRCDRVEPVSYTHLDVYKRQLGYRLPHRTKSAAPKKGVALSLRAGAAHKAHPRICPGAGDGQKQISPL